MVYGPIAAWLVELFPTRIRYTGLSLPYHIGNGWFGGFLPATVFAIVAATGNIYSGLWYPIVVAVDELRRRLFFLPETKDATSPSNPGTAGYRKTTTGRGAIRGRFLFVLWLGCAADELQHDLAPVRPRAVLDDIDALPGAERHLAVKHRNLQRRCGQHGLDMRRHVIRPLGVVHPAGIFGRKPLERRGRSTSTEGSAFSWIVSEAEVWRMNSVSAPSCAPASRRNFAASRVTSVKPVPRVSTTSEAETILLTLTADGR